MATTSSGYSTTVRLETPPTVGATTDLPLQSTPLAVH